MIRRIYHNNVPGSSSRKLAKTLEPKESDRGHLEIAPTQSKKPPTSGSFLREEAPHTTRVPAPLWSGRRPVERLVRRSSDRREPERSFRDRGREGDRGYSREQTFRGTDAGKNLRSFRDRGREGDGGYSREQTFRGTDAGKNLRSFRDRGREGDGGYSREQTFRGTDAGKKVGSFRDRGREGDGGYSREQTFRGTEAGKDLKVVEKNDTRYYAYKQYLERRDSRPGKCSVSYHKIAKI
jgi:hypothetical protein